MLIRRGITGRVISEGGCVGVASKKQKTGGIDTPFCSNGGTNKRKRKRSASSLHPIFGKCVQVVVKQVLSLQFFFFFLIGIFFFLPFLFTLLFQFISKHYFVTIAPGLYYRDVKRHFIASFAQSDDIESRDFFFHFKIACKSYLEMNDEIKGSTQLRLQLVCTLKFGRNFFNHSFIFLLAKKNYLEAQRPKYLRRGSK